jgi:membrane associated rhomboid family serine protease
MVVASCVHLHLRHQTLTFLSAVHRLNLFPVMHLNFFHMIFNLVALAPLLERFESEFGTLVTLALFTGRKKYKANDMRIG